MPGFATTIERKPLVSAPSNVELHAGTLSAMQNVIDRCEKLTAADNSLTQQDRETLKRLAGDLKGRLDLADAVQEVRKLSERLETKDWDTLRKELDEAFKP